ncbi:MAG: PqqD family protein [Actinomycetota bacterium]|nr:PqqD family protein [Actinomycetota bacterium]MDQ6948063.1 PqqD family protein [Actinomycetota bacterium]
MSERKTFRLNPAAVQWRIVDDEVLALDLRTSCYIAINRTGKQIWPLLVRGTTEAELRDEIARVWAVDPLAAGRDVAAFVAQLEADGLLLEVTTESPGPGASTA